MNTFIKNIFNSPIAPPPHSFEISFSDIKTSEELFERILHIYKSGLVILLGDQEGFDLRNLTDDNRLLMKQYMKSIGINTKIYTLNNTDVHDIYEMLAIKLEEKNIQFDPLRINGKIYDLRIIAKINQINIIDNIIKDDIYIRCLINMKNPTHLNHHCIRIQDRDTCYILFFDYL